MIKSSLFKAFLFCVACVVSGWIAAFAMPPVSFWPCLFVGISGLFILFSRTKTAGQAFFAGLFFALGYFVTGLWWIGNALLVEGNDFAWVWPISVIGLPTLLGLFTGTYLAIARMAAPAGTFKSYLAFVFFLAFSDWARGHAFTGFPWNLYGYVWADHLAMAQSVHFIGSYGLTLLSVAWAAIAGYLVLAKISTKAKILTATTTALFMTLVWAGGQYRLDTGKTVFDDKIGLVVVQPNIPQNMKWDPEVIQNNFQKIISLSRAGDYSGKKPEKVFIVWPETAISPLTYTVPENMKEIETILNNYKGTDAYLITGILLRREDEKGVRFSNSIVILDKKMANLGEYDKYHLVPFGEFIPFQDWIPLKPVAAFKGFQRGHGPETMSIKDIPPFSPLICYEVIFPDQVTNKIEKPRPQWIVNVTNDGWYGDSAGPHQHFAQTRLRAIEEGIPVIRSANTGISGVIDPYGRVIEKADIFQEAALITNLPKALEGTTPYWPWAFQLCLPFLALVFIVRSAISLARGKSYS